MQISIEAWHIAVAFGVPTALTGFFIRYFEKRLDKKDRQRAEETEQKEEDRLNREKEREDMELLVIKSINAAIALGEATAECVQRLDPQCNGHMKTALEYAREVKHEQKDFLTRQAVKAVV